jgi:hypothetical protein
MLLGILTLDGCGSVSRPGCCSVPCSLVPQCTCSLGIEVAFVAAHHIVRVSIVMIAAGPVFTLLDRRK